MEQSLRLLAAARATATGRTLRVELDGAAPRASAGREPWPARARTICARSDGDGEPMFTIDEHPDAEATGRVGGRERGEYLLDRTGTRLWCSPGGEEPAWERFLVGQVLPFAALLSGLEIFHASAVELDGGALAIAGPSGAGKTSVALALCELGAAFLADDVLALEIAGEQLLAHPGAPVAGVDRREDERRRHAGVPLPPSTLGATAGSGSCRCPAARSRWRCRRCSSSTASRCPRGRSRSSGRRRAAGAGSDVQLRARKRAADARAARRLRMASAGRVERVRVPAAVDAGEVAAAIASA